MHLLDVVSVCKLNRNISSTFLQLYGKRKPPSNFNVKLKKILLIMLPSMVNAKNFSDRPCMVSGNLPATAIH